MSLRSVLLSLFLIVSSLYARNDIVLSLPAAGTGYLKNVIEEITYFDVIRTSTTLEYVGLSCNYDLDEDVVVIGALFDPVVFQFIHASLPIDQRKLFMIRDPRDIILSAIDSIDQNGVNAWPYLGVSVKENQWKECSFQEKVALLLEKQPMGYNSVILSGLELGKALCESGHCILIKYENISLENSNLHSRRLGIKAIASFFDIEVDDEEADQIVADSWGGTFSLTFRKGNIYRYKNELREEDLYLLNQKLYNYLQFFNYDV